MKKLLILLCLLSSFIPSLFATHNKGGEITYEVLNAATRTYRVTITTYSKYCPNCNPAPPDRQSLDSVHWGDGQIQMFNRISFSDSLGDSTRVNHYVATHSYASPGAYRIYFVDPNRNDGIVNIPSSVNIPFCTESYIAVIDPPHCPNNSVQFTSAPIFKAMVGTPFIHTIAVIDPDHDSLSFELAVPLMMLNTPVPGYTLPFASNSLTVNSVSGQLKWDSPSQQGNYAFAIKINEWRDGYRVGYVIRDFQLNCSAIGSALNVFDSVPFPQDAQGNYFTSANAGDTVNLHVRYYGHSNPQLIAFGEALNMPAPPAIQFSSSVDTAVADFTWLVSAYYARRHPYIFTLRGSCTGSIAGKSQADFTFLVYVNGTVTDTCTTPPFIGFGELAGNTNEVKIFPNPATSELRIENAALKIKEIEIYSVLGKKVYSQQPQTSNLKPQTIDVSQLPSGIYFVRVKTDKGISAAKFVKE